jgi:hypothetical protein
MLQGMGGDPRPPATPAGQTRFSADGYWWWDGSAWKPAMSEDRLWRWNGMAWEPARPLASRPSGGGAGTAIAITVTVFVGIVVLVAGITIVILLTMSNQMGNVFANVAAALNGSPSP